MTSGPHGHRVRVHQAAGRVLRIDEHALEAGAVLLVEGMQHALRDGLGQVADEVGEIVDLHRAGGGDELLVVHAADQPGAHFLGGVEEHLAFVVGVDGFPEELALRRRERVEQQRDLGGLEREQHAPDGAQATALDGGAHGVQPALR